ncbi:hypothetical protein AN958_09968 [Leucoagaricus sp. SymC.cos]|nr:hypothetical protein AN958_09968 [Leucoagaricus sp. SymC.cos]
MNMSQTGYKLRKHIAKALRTRSQAITTALKQYNTAAAAMIPPRPTLTWNRVVQYAFLSEFDLLRDSREDVRERPWAKPASRALMDRYFKICCAHEEIERLNVEIRRIITHMQDEDKFLRSKAHDISLTDPHLSHQVLKYHSLRAQFNSQHMHRFNKLAKTLGWSGTLEAGTSIDKSMHAVTALTVTNPNSQSSSWSSTSRISSHGKHLLEDSDDDDDQENQNDGDQLEEGLDALITIGY